MTYRPLLRWKRGEQTALANLDEAHKREVQPLLVIKGHSYDPPQGQSNDPAFDTRIVQDADRLRGAWLVTELPLILEMLTRTQSALAASRLSLGSLLYSMVR